MIKALFNSSCKSYDSINILGDIEIKSGDADAPGLFTDLPAIPICWFKTSPLENLGDLPLSTILSSN